jgi:hypothetical protein
MTRVLAIAVMASCLSAFDYGVAKTPAADQRARQMRHVDVVHGDVVSPYRYRVLAPAVIEAMTRVAAIRWPYDVAFRRSFTLFTLLSLVLLLVAQYRYLREWFAEEQAIVGMLLVAVTVRITFEDNTLPYAPWSWIEAAMLTEGLLAVYQRRIGRIVALTIAAALNRETGVLVPIAALVDAVAERSVRHAIAAVGSIALSVAIYGGLRWVLHPSVAVYSVASIWQTNTSGEGFRAAIQNASLFLGVAGWALALLGARRSPPFVRRMFWLLPVYAPMYLVWGIWYEVRLLTPLYPILIPPIVSWLYEPSHRRVQEAA